MGQKQVKVSIIIPVHNELDYLLKCIISIKEKTHTEHEIIISDSNSTRPMNENFYDELLNQGVIDKVIYDYTPGGFSRAVNNGMCVATGDYVCWLNSDTIICTDNWLQKMIDVMDKTGSCVVGPISNSASYQSFIQCKEKEKEKISEYLNDYNGYCETFLPNGYCVLMKSDVIENTGLLNEYDFPHYGSEDDYFLRVNGIKAMACNVFVWHYGKTSYRENRTKLTKQAVIVLNKLHQDIDEKVMLTEISCNNAKTELLKHLMRKSWE